MGTESGGEVGRGVKKGEKEGGTRVPEGIPGVRASAQALDQGERIETGGRQWAFRDSGVCTGVLLPPGDLPGV